MLRFGFVRIACVVMAALGAVGCGLKAPEGAAENAASDDADEEGSGTSRERSSPDRDNATDEEEARSASGGRQRPRATSDDGEELDAGAPELDDGDDDDVDAFEGEPEAPSVEWTTFNYDRNNSRNNRAESEINVENVAGLRRAWEMSLSDGLTSTPIVTQGMVYVGDHAGALYGIDATTGDGVWRVNGLFAPRTSTPLVAGDVVFAAGGQRLYARRRSDGAQLWTAMLNSHPQTMIDSSPTLVGDKIVIGVANYELITARSDYTGRGAVVALDAADGREVWRWWAANDDGSEGAGVSVWSSAAYDPQRGLVFIGTGQPYEFPAAEHANSLVALDVEDGALVWYNQFHSEDVFTQPGGCQGGRSQPACDFDIGASPNLFVADGKDVVGVGSKGGLYRVVDRDQGSVVWERQLGSGSWWGGVMAVAATDDHAIYVVNNAYQNGEAMFALDQDTGEVIWETSMPFPVWGAVSIANGVLYVTAKDGVLRAFDAENGTELQAWDVGHDCAGGVSISDGVVYVSSGFTGLGEVRRPGARLSAFSLR
jgi:polyvinyl alcohol dehydrogenase (cytochrome)